jgi:holin-like protein
MSGVQAATVGGGAVRVRLGIVAATIAGGAILFGLLHVGDALSGWIPLPGALIGMVLLAVLVSVDRSAVSRAAVACGKHLLRHYALFFVPAGVGVMGEAGLLRTSWVPVAVGLVGSSLLSLVATAFAMQALLRWRETRRG